MVPSRICCTLASIIVFCLAMISLTESAPLSSHSNAYYRELDEAPEEVLMDLMERFGQTILKARDDLENSKRTVDFGLGRGFSGIQEAKHRMGMAAANFPGGPGRRRRSETEA